MTNEVDADFIMFAHPGQEAMTPSELRADEELEACHECDDRDDALEEDEIEEEDAPDAEVTLLVVEREAVEVLVPTPRVAGDVYKIRSPFRKVEVDCGRTYAFPIEKGEMVTLKAFRSDMPKQRHTLYWKLIASKMVP
jgi:hypothetical protein